MANKRINKLIILALLMSLSLAMALNPVLADSSGEKFEIRIEGSEHKLLLWKLDNDFTDGLEKLRELDNWTNEELDRVYGPARLTEAGGKDQSILVNLEEGRYYLRGYGQGAKYISPSIFSAPLAGDEKVVKIKPRENGSLKLIKIDKDGNRLAGAKFSISDSDGNPLKLKLGDRLGHYKYSLDGEIIFLETNYDGEILVEGLPLGRYTIKEEIAPKGYKIKGDGIYTFEIRSGQTETSEILVVNDKDDERGSGKFRKVDGSSHSRRPLRGARFKVTIEDDRGRFIDYIREDGSIYIVESDRDGVFYVEDLPYGVYYLWEIRPPIGYESLKDYVRIEIGPRSYMETIEINNYQIPPPPPKIPPEIPPGIPPEIPPETPHTPPTIPMEPGKVPKGPPPTPPSPPTIPIVPPAVPKSPIKIPKTGEITLLMMVLSGIGMILLGSSIVKRES